MATTLGKYNPLRYRGYVYDEEYGLYYLQSRYYNPEVGRFLNEDALVSTGQDLLGINMFCYCGNSPVSNADRDGREREYLRTINGYYGGGYSATSVAAIVTVIVAPLVAEAKTAVSNITQAIRKHAKKLRDTSKSIYDDSQPRIHHIVPQGDFTNRSKPTQEAVAGMHEILKSVEMDVNHPLNLAVISQGYHKSLHTDAYLQNLYM